MLKTSSAKSKGRKLQQWLAALLIEAANDCGISLTAKDIRSTPSSVSGPDIQMSEAATKVFPFDFECKNEANPQNIYGRYFKFQEKHKLPTIAVFKKTNRSKSSDPLFVVSGLILDWFHWDAIMYPELDYCVSLTAKRCNVIEYFYTLQQEAAGEEVLFEYRRLADECPIYVMSNSLFLLFIKFYIKTGQEPQNE